MNKIEKESYLQKINCIIEEYINTPDDQKSITSLSEKYEVKRKNIIANLKKRNIAVIFNKQPRLNQHKFDEIDTEEKAYWLGFLYADGCNQLDKGTLSINLSSKDFDFLNKFRDFLEIKNKVSKYTVYDKYEMCRIYVHNDYICKKLNELGCVQRKSLILKFPDLSIFKNKSLVYDFIRGYCDGDGSLGLYIKKGCETCEISFVGTNEFLTELQNVLQIEGCLRNKSYANYKNNASELKYSNFKARQVARLLYENSTIYLDRKYKMFEDFCRFEEESSRAKSSKISRRWDANTEVNLEIAKGSESPQRVEGE